MWLLQTEEDPVQLEQKELWDIDSHYFWAQIYDIFQVLYCYIAVVTAELPLIYFPQASYRAAY